MSTQEAVVVPIETELIESYYDRPLTEKETRLKFALSRTQIIEIRQKSAAGRLAQRNRTLVDLHLKTGLRANELVNIVVPRVDLANRRILVDRVEARGPYRAFRLKTPQSRRYINIPASLLTDVSDLVAGRKAGYLFVSQKGGKMGLSRNSYIDLINGLAVACPSIGFTIGSHCLRRTYATYISKHVPPLALMRALGHKNFRTTQLYLQGLTDFDEMDGRAPLEDAMYVVEEDE